MLKKRIPFLFFDYKHLKSRTVLLVLFLVAFFIRFPFFFRDYIDRDESTFILLGQSWANGNLPYTELWDLKPPVIYLFFAIIIKFFGKSFIAIRLFGTIVVAVIAFFGFKIGKGISSKKIAFWAALFCVLLLSLFGSLQGVMSEHISMLFFVPGLYLFINPRKKYFFLFSGFLMGLAIMTKLNLAYAILFLGLYYLYDSYAKKQFGKGFMGMFLLGIGVVSVILFTFLPYYYTGIPEVWWQSVIQAPLQYATFNFSGVLKVLPLCILIFLFLFLCWKKKRIDFKNNTIQLLTIAIIGVLFSFLKGGKINGHYLIQLYPILIILIAIVIAQIDFFQKAIYKPVAIIVLLLLPFEAYKEYYAIINHKIERGTFFNGEGISVPNYLLKNKLNDNTVFFAEYHIGYWKLNQNPPTKAATHPSNITRDHIFPFYDNPRTTAMAELRYILEDQKPQIIVTRRNKLVFNKRHVALNIYINTYLQQHYSLLQTIDNAEIYQLLQ